MSYKPFYISSFENESGLDTYYESFLIPEKAFPELEDAFAWRGRIRRRDAFELLGRLRREIVDLSEAATSGAANYTVADILTSIRADQPNAEIQPDTLVITISAGNVDETIYNDNGLGGITFVSGPYTISSGTINYITGQLVLNFTGVPVVGKTVDVSLFYYPSLPVMGLPTRETININDEEIVAFDTIYAYRFVTGQFQEFPSVTPTTWSGSDSDFFWATNYWQTAGNNELFWVTNFFISDPIRYWDQSDWTDFAPILRADDATTPTVLTQARIIIPYKDRLVVLNTVETDTTGFNNLFPQRARWSQNGDPTIIGTVQAGPSWNVVGAWADDVVGKGGYVDAYTNEQIISAEFIKDVLIVKFERSSWKLLYTGNETLPFIWQKINTELGAESTFSLIPFDKGVFSVGNVGIMTDDSINVSRIDQRIPQTVFNINNDNEGVKRVYGIRDFVNELALWTYPNSAENPTYPNKILVYNYVNQTWAIFNDSFTCFGYFQRQDDLSWETIPYTSWNAWNTAWNSGAIQSAYPDIIGGNQQGFVEILFQDNTFNDPSLAITAIAATLAGQAGQITVPNHNLQSGQFIKITGIMGTGSDGLNDTIYKIIDIIDANNFTFINEDSATMPAVSGTYVGGGLVTVLNNINILTKRFSPFYDQGSQCRLGYVDFFFDKTSDGEVTVNLLLDESSSIIVNDPTLVGNVDTGLLGDNTVLTRQESTDIPYQANQDKIWHRMYTYAIAQNFQLQITLDDHQMFSQDINSSDIVLHAMTLYLSPNARLLQ